MGVNGEALQLHAVYKKPYFLLQVTRESVSVTASHARIRIRYCKSRENPYQVLQVTCAASERAIKSEVRIINYYHHSTKLYWKKYHSLVAVCIVTHAAHS